LQLQESLVLVLSYIWLWGTKKDGHPFEAEWVPWMLVGAVTVGGAMPHGYHFVMIMVSLNIEGNSWSHASRVREETVE
jgi:hypothetical protein